MLAAALLCGSLLAPSHGFQLLQHAASLRNLRRRLFLLLLGALHLLQRLGRRRGRLVNQGACLTGCLEQLSSRLLRLPAQATSDEQRIKKCCAAINRLLTFSAFCY